MAKRKQSKSSNRKHGRNAKKCAAYAAAHGVLGKRRFRKSKEHRARGPLGIALSQRLRGDFTFTTRRAELDNL